MKQRRYSEYLQLIRNCVHDRIGNENEKECQGKYKRMVEGNNIDEMKVLLEFFFCRCIFFPLLFLHLSTCGISSEILTISVLSISEIALGVALCPVQNECEKEKEMHVSCFLSFFFSSTPSLIVQIKYSSVPAVIITSIFISNSEVPDTYF